jgi:hypothetical protein
VSYKETAGTPGPALQVATRFPHSPIGGAPPGVHPKSDVPDPEVVEESERRSGEDAAKAD